MNQDFDNLYNKLQEAVSAYNITDIPILLQSEEPDHRTIVFQNIAQFKLWLKFLFNLLDNILR